MARTAAEIKSKIATTLFSLEIGGIEPDSPIDGAHYALSGIWNWIEEGDHE